MVILSLDIMQLSESVIKRKFSWKMETFDEQLVVKLPVFHQNNFLMGNLPKCNLSFIKCLLSTTATAQGKEWVGEVGA